jgi:hypothetical protein
MCQKKTPKENKKNSRGLPPPSPATLPNGGSKHPPLLPYQCTEHEINFAKNKTHTQHQEEHVHHDMHVGPYKFHRCHENGPLD